MSGEISSEAADTAHALNCLLEIKFGIVASEALNAGIELGVFEALAAGPIALDELAARVHLRPIACRRLLMALASLGLVASQQGQFRNTKVGQFCTSQADVNLAAACRISPFVRLCEYLPDALREYGPRWEQAHGGKATATAATFESLYADPVRLREFADMMDAFSIPQGRLIAECFDFRTRECVMDIAGGAGGQAIQIGLKYPQLKGIVTDLEPVCAVAEERIAANGLSSRFSAVSSDLMTGPYPSGADVALLGHILHDWDDQACLRILRNCAAALPEQGVLLISESVLDEDFSGRNQANLKDLIMLVGNEQNARERSVQEYRSLLNETGFDVVEVIQLEAPRDLVVARKR